MERFKSTDETRQYADYLSKCMGRDWIVSYLFSINPNLVVSTSRQTAQKLLGRRAEYSTKLRHPMMGGGFHA